MHLSSQNEQSMITLKGILERIVFHNPDNHYMIARLRADDSKQPITVVGYMPGVNSGETLTVSGDWETHAKFGEQFKVSAFEMILPATVEGIEKYLKSGIIKGIGSKLADRLIAHFADQTLDIIEKDPQRLLEVEGVGSKSADRIVAAWQTHQGIRELMDFLYEYHISPAFGAKLLQHYGDRALSVAQNAPYQLFRDIPEFDFHNVDYLAGQMGIPRDDPGRIEACIDYQVRSFVDEGNTYIPKSTLLEFLKKRFGIEPTVADPMVENLILSGWLTEEIDEDGNGDRVCLFPTYLYEAEKHIAHRLKAMLTVPLSPPDLKKEQIRAKLAQKMAIVPSEEQLHILENILNHRVVIVTGGPGTGKTTLVRAITMLLNDLGETILLAAPTGRAARRLSEVTRQPAETIHKMLRFNLSTGEFDKNQDDPVEADTVIVDEVSMVDTVLMAQLINAVSMASRLILIGDAFQLPSIGPGNVLADMIHSILIPSFELKTIFRQAHESPIVLSAHKVRNGDMPDLSPYDHPTGMSEFFFIEEEVPANAVNTIVALCAEKFPEKLNLNPLSDVQVITPMHKGEVGTLNLNQVLQKKMNPGKRNQIKGGRFKLHDKVMHLKNNYQKEVFNGDIGTICHVDSEKSVLTVNYDNRSVAYGFDELDELSLAYAISVHKSQGSEYPAVIVPLMTQHFPLLQRNLLYTAITRGSHIVVVIGTRKALRIALNNNLPEQRLSRLGKRLDL